MVRKDLPDWPTPGKIDGSAHSVGQRGFVFLFNPNKDPLYRPTDSRRDLLSTECWKQSRSGYGEGPAMRGAILNEAIK